MLDMSLPLILVGLLCIAVGVIAARVAHRAYALTLAGASTGQILVVGFLAISLMGELDSKVTMIIIGVALAAGLITWVTSRLKFLWLWSSLCMLLLFIVIGIMTLTGVDISRELADMAIWIMLGCFVASLGATFFLRAYAAPLIVGISTGINVGVGLGFVVIAILFKSDAIHKRDLIDVLPYVTILLALACIGAGIFYQLKIDTRLLEKESKPKAS
ncbi:MAG: hypothetical protein J5I53_09635 [Bradyrhizobiaceae bacterium]|nr:hypothetical protein [Bradyrhizobiaceae bacterium]